jgi:dTDP-4-dehydrorhamnose reductase
MAKKKVVILGGKGMLGSDLTSLYRSKGLQVLSLDLPEFDITNTDNLQKALNDAELVINCAAYTNVEKAESEKDLAFKINADAVGRLGQLAKNYGLWVLHTSTDFVFDGTKQIPYNEEDRPNPINVYGKSKLAGEKLLVESGCQYCIIRLQWTYGLKGSNFVTKLISAAKQKNEMKVVDDQLGSPTSTEEVAKVIYKLTEIKPQGFYHFASEGFTSRFEMAGFIFEKLDMPVTLKRCKTSDFPGAAARPLNSRFDCSKIKMLLDEPIEHWQKPLEQYLKKLI